MGETIEQAQEGIERAHHAQVHEQSEVARWTAVLVAVLAAALAITELGEKASQTEYLTRHIAVSDDYAYYQEKHVRLTMLQAEEGLLASLPGAGSADVQERLKAVRAEQKRLQDNPASGQGMNQLQAKAEQESELRDHAFHRAHRLELVVGALQIAIVLASVSVITRVRLLAWGAACLGAAMSAYGLILWLSAG